MKNRTRKDKTDHNEYKNLFETFKRQSKNILLFKKFMKYIDHIKKSWKIRENKNEAQQPSRETYCQRKKHY